MLLRNRLCLIVCVVIVTGITTFILQPRACDDSREQLLSLELRLNQLRTRFGATDRDARAVTARPVSCKDVFATLYRNLGIDARRSRTPVIPARRLPANSSNFDVQGRPGKAGVKGCITRRKKAKHDVMRFLSGGADFQNTHCGDPPAAPPKHGNFSDPVVLTWRLLSSGGAVVRWMLSREFVSGLCVPVDIVLQALERRVGNNTGGTDLPLILIVGLPRSETTRLYQLLVHFLDVSYFTNLTSMCLRSPLVTKRLLQRNSDPGPLDFLNLYGTTAGLRGPNDGRHIWSRFLGNDRYDVSENIPVACGGCMAAFYDARLSMAGHPLLNKNNRNTMCVK